MTVTGCSMYRNVIANTTESKEEILLMLYAEALTYLGTAKIGIEEQNPKLKGEKISKVLTILTELDCALDMEKGGELAENLSSLYQYLVNRLTIANIKYDLDALEEVEELLSELYEGFKYAVRHESSPILAGNDPLETTGRFAIAI